MARIAVSGGGIAGMAAALAGAKAGHDVVLFSGETNGGAAAPLPGGLQIAPNGWAALTQLGLSDAAASCSTQLNSILVRSLGRGTTLIHLPLAGGYASFSRQAMYRLLRDALEAETNIDQIAINVEHINQQTDGLTLVSSDGQSVFCDGLIAAEGGSGPGRRHVTSSGPPDSSGRRVAMRAQINLEHLPAHFARPASNLWLGSGRHVVHYPLETTLNVVVTMPGEEISSGWQQRLLGRDAVLSPLADPQISWAKTSLPGAATVACWRRGRVVLAGDAAHSMPPHLAQGAGQGLVDAACLGRWLDQSDESSSLKPAFSGYARERAAAVGRIVQKADVSGRVMGLSGPAARLRDVVLNIGGPRLMQSWLAEVWAADATLDTAPRRQA